jgi:hypothetical protein
MHLIDEIKIALRVSNTNDVFDVGEIEPLMDAARQELMLSGVSNEKLQKDKLVGELDTNLDPLIKRAITVYVKANFGWDNPEAKRFQESFELLKQYLCLAGDYNATP